MKVRLKGGTFFEFLHFTNDFLHFMNEFLHLNCIREGCVVQREDKHKGGRQCIVKYKQVQSAE